jgi:hypothetical protein
MMKHSLLFSVLVILVIAIFLLPAGAVSAQTEPASPEVRDPTLRPYQIVEAVAAPTVAPKIVAGEGRPFRDGTPVGYPGGCAEEFSDNRRGQPSSSGTANQSIGIENRRTGATDFRPAVNVATIAGAKIGRILVRKWGDYGSKRFLTWTDVTHEIETVWAAQVGGANYPWAEMVTWNVTAELEFATSSVRGCLMTDGHHVSLRDVNGRVLQFRIAPAAQR